MRWRLTAAVALLVVSAGCSSFVGFDDADDTVTPAPVPTDPPPEPIPPPGVTDSGLHSATTLSVAHREALKNRSYTLHERYRGTLQSDDGTATLVRNETTYVTGIRTYRHELRRERTFLDGRVRSFQQSTYGDGERWFERQVIDGNVSYRDGEINFGRDQFAFETAFYVNQYVTTNETWAQPVVRNGTQFFRVVGDGGNPPWAPLLAQSDVYRVAMLVDSNGLVHRLDVRYETPTEEIRYSFWYEDLDATTVGPPAWLGEAQAQRTSENETNGSAQRPATATPR